MAQETGAGPGDGAVLRWGVLSTANIGRAAVNPAIQASSNGELVAVASRDSARAAEFARAHGIPRAHGSYRALLEDDEVDAVYIPLPNSLHRDWTLEAAESGKHVLCEKPLALDPAECQEMAAVAAAAGVVLMEAFMYRFHPRMSLVAELIREGTIGDVRTIRSAFTFRLRSPDNIRLNPDLGGGALMDVGCYCVNVSRTLAGAEPVEVQATANWAGSGVDDHLAGILRFPDGLLAHFDCALTLERRELVEVSGTDGTLIVPDAFLPGTGDVAVDVHRGRSALETRMVGGADEYLLMVEHFADAVLSGRPVRYPPEEAAANMAAICALLESARQGGVPVSL